MPSARIPKEFCVRCKGARNLCGLGYCPLLVSLRNRIKSFMWVRGREIGGASPPTVIVGESGYPNVNVYLGVPPGVFGDKAKIYDSPSDWHPKLSLSDIIGLRARLLHASMKVNIKNPELLYEKEVGLAGVSLKPVDMEARLRKPPRLVVTFNLILPPSGPAAPVEQVRVTDNPKLHPSLEKLIWDDVRARDAAWYLYRSNLDFYTIVRALTLGFLGRKRDRRIVPTRWGMTAVDSIISTHLLKRVRQKPSVSNVLVFHSSYLHNKYTVIVTPGSYRTTWFEVWMPSSLWNPSSSPSALVISDDFKGNLTYMDGGFIAARTPVLEYLAEIGKQARTIILREIEPGYIYPVGSWQIRLTVKYALSKGPIMRNPTSIELKEFLTSKHSVPAWIIDKVLLEVYGKKSRSLLDYATK